jgi:hypothetical protein
MGDSVQIGMLGIAQHPDLQILSAILTGAIAWRK